MKDDAEDWPIMSINIIIIIVKAAFFAEGVMVELAVKCSLKLGGRTSRLARAIPDPGMVGPADSEPDIEAGGFAEVDGCPP